MMFLLANFVDAVRPRHFICMLRVEDGKDEVSGLYGIHVECGRNSRYSNAHVPTCVHGLPQLQDTAADCVR